MNEKDLEELIRPLKAKELKDEVKKRGLKAGRCPTKMDLARLLPEDVVRKMVKK